MDNAAQPLSELERLRMENTRLAVLLDSARADWRSAVLAAGGQLPDDAPAAPDASATATAPDSAAAAAAAGGDADAEDTDADADAGALVDDGGAEATDAEAAALRRVERRAVSVPLRLTYDERKFMRLVESALHVSEYTGAIATERGGGGISRRRVRGSGRKTESRRWDGARE